MKNLKRNLLILTACFLCLNYSTQASESIAVVDLQKIVSNSAQVKQLKQDHSKKMDELNRIIINARGEISTQTDANKIAQIEEKYTKEFNTKKNSLEKEYNNKLELIEKSIKDEIAKKAQKDKYDYVFAKSVLLYGGKDITNEINIK